MKFSIITVVYNAQDTIETTIKSLISQTFGDFEWIVIDGCSNDSTLEIIKNYSDNVSKLISEPDNGLYYAMNKGVMAAKGDYILFLNGNDTFYDDDVLECVSNFIDENKMPDFVYGGVNFKNFGAQDVIEKYEEIDFEKFFITGNICHQSIFYKRDLFEKIGLYNTKYKFFADKDFNIRCILKNDIKTQRINKTISNFVYGGMSSGKACRNERFFEDLKLVKNYFPKESIKYFLHSFSQRFFGNLYRKLSEPFNPSR